MGLAEASAEMIAALAMRPKPPARALRPDFVAAGEALARKLEDAIESGERGSLDAILPQVHGFLHLAASRYGLRSRHRRSKNPRLLLDLVFTAMEAAAPSTGR